MPKQVLTDLDMGGAARVINLPAPVNPADAVTKAYVDAAGGGGGGVSIQTVEVNFTAPRDTQTFTVMVAGALTSQRVIASISCNMPVGVDADELEMDPLSVAGSVTAADQVTLVVSSTTGSRIRGRRNINLILG